MNLRLQEHVHFKEELIEKKLTANALYDLYEKMRVSMDLYPVIQVSVETINIEPRRANGG